MSQKREVPTPLKTVLDWDVNTTRNLVKFIDTQFGPLIKYKHFFKTLEVSFLSNLYKCL